MSDAMGRGPAPRVTVVVPTFNRARDVARCLESLVAQTFRDFEVLVCDDGSKDNTREVVEGFRDRLNVEYHWAENWGGPARPRNIGIRLARGEYLAFLDSDDWWKPEKLARSVQALDGGADVVYHDMYKVLSADQRHFWRRQHTAALTPPVFQDLLDGGNVIINSSVVARTSLLRDIGGLSEERALIAAEDYDGWLRLARRTEKFVRLPECLGYYWLGGGHISSAKRALVNLAFLDEQYLGGASNGAKPGWYHYMVGLAHYELRSNREAVGHLRKARGTGVSWLQAIKAHILALLAARRSA